MTESRNNTGGVLVDVAIGIVEIIVVATIASFAVRVLLPEFVDEEPGAKINSTGVGIAVWLLAVLIGSFVAIRRCRRGKSVNDQ